MVPELVAAFSGYGSDIIINSSSVTASSTNGAGIGGGRNGNSCENITINSSSVTASSKYGAGIGGGKGYGRFLQKYYH